MSPGISQGERNWRTHLFKVSGGVGKRAGRKEALRWLPLTPCGERISVRGMVWGKKKGLPARTR